MECVDLGKLLSSMAPDKGGQQLGLSGGGGPILGRGFEPKGTGVVYGRVYTRWLPYLRAASACTGILVLRDPRDAAISLFYSWAYSHVALPREDGEGRLQRQNALQQEGLLGWLERKGLGIVKNEFDKGRALCHSNLNILKTHYEDMVLDWGGFFRGITDHLAIGESIDFAKYDLQREFTVDREDILSHKRRVKPENWREVFTPQLVEAAKRVYGEALEQEGYLWC